MGSAGVLDASSVSSLSTCNNDGVLTAKGSNDGICVESSPRCSGLPMRRRTRCHRRAPETTTQRTCHAKSVAASQYGVADLPDRDRHEGSFSSEGARGGFVIESARRSVIEIQVSSSSEMACTDTCTELTSPFDDASTSFPPCARHSSALE